MHVNPYFYNMESQLSLFGFEEPQPSVNSDQKKDDTEKNKKDTAKAAQETANKPNDLFAPSVAPQTEATPILDNDAATAAIEEETEKAEAFLEEKLNEIVTPNTYAPIDALRHETDAEFPIFEENAAENTSETPSLDFSNIESQENDFPEEHSEADILEQHVNELDEIPVPNQEIPSAENILEQDLAQDDFEAVLENANIEPEENDFSEEHSEAKTTKSEKPEPKEEVTESPFVNSYGKKGRKSFKEIDAEVDLIQVPSDEVLFSKQYYPISQVAKWFRVNNSLLRFWENEFDILKPRKNRKGDRLFRPEDIKNLRIIYYLLRQKKYTIAGARKYIKNNRKTVDVNMKIIQTFQEFKRFLLELKVNSER